MDQPSTSPWRSEPSLRETAVIWAISALVFVVTVSVFKPYLNLVDNFGDNGGYMSIAAAIRKWDFHGVLIKHFWGLSYFMSALSILTGASDRTALLLVSAASSAVAVVLAYKLWGGWIAVLFATLNLDWHQRSYLGGSEPLFVALLFGSFLAIRNQRWVLAALLASLATITRPLGILLLVGIGMALIWKRNWNLLVLATALALGIGILYMVPLAYYFHDPLATVHSYQGAKAGSTVPLFGIPFYAIIKGTLLYPAPWTNLVLSFGWIALVTAGTVAMIATQSFRTYARRHVAETVFAALYLLSLYCYNYPAWARSNFARFAIPIVPFALIALKPWLPRDRRFLWLLVPVTAILAASSAIGIQNVIHALRGRS